MEYIYKLFGYKTLKDLNLDFYLEKCKNVDTGEEIMELVEMYRELYVRNDYFGVKRI